MTHISRRDLLVFGVALSASSLLARSAWARTTALLGGLCRKTASAEALAAVAPREQLLFDFGWKFQFGHGSDPAHDLGFGIRSGQTLPRPATSSLPRPSSTTRSGARSTCRTTGPWNCHSSRRRASSMSHGFKPLGPALSGDQRGLVPARVRDSGRRSGQAHLQSSSMAPSAT